MVARSRVDNLFMSQRYRLSAASVNDFLIG